MILTKLVAHAANFEIEAASIIAAALLVWLSAIVQNVSNAFRRGPAYVMSNRSIAPPMDGFFGRATRTLANNMESALMYVPPMIIVIATGQHNETVAITAATYIGTRSVFVLCYWLNIRGPLRSISWLAGMICCAIIFAFAIIGLVSST
jgi:uncharacterized MAPEG superfamily protein